MRPYIQGKKGIPGGINFFNAYQAFSEMGLECVLFNDVEELDTSLRSDVVVGGLGIVQHALSRFGVTPPHIDYPEELTHYLGRRIWTSTLDKVVGQPNTWPVFVKPFDEKRFTGVVVLGESDLRHLGGEQGQSVLCSDPVELVAEWRCFVRYGTVLDVRPYAGDWHAHYDAVVIDGIVRDYASAPAGYAADVGVTLDGRTLLVEVNDGYALGCYGLQHNLYAKLLSARWAELVGVPDECAF